MKISEYQSLFSDYDTFSNTSSGDKEILEQLYNFALELVQVDAKRISSDISYEEAQKLKFSTLSDLINRITMYSLRMGFDLESLIKYNARKMSE